MSDDWRSRALCAEVGGDFWFPEDKQIPTAAKEICGRCPVRDACLTDALERGDVQWGVFGGKSPRERQKMLRVRPVEEKPDERLPLVISRTLAGYSDEVIARELGVNVRTVYRIRARARAA